MPTGSVASALLIGPLAVGQGAMDDELPTALLPTLPAQASGQLLAHPAASVMFGGGGGRGGPSGVPAYCRVGLLIHLGRREAPHGRAAKLLDALG